MSCRIALSVCTLALVAACSDDKKADDLRTGTFVDSPVANLRFQTPTQSGLTNAAGEFKYKAGESVTFTVGGITLGVAVGADQITPFDLAGIAPPATQHDINALLNGPLPNAFHRAINIAHFLQGMDDDANPDNGIDLGTFDVELAAESLTFDSFPSVFVRSGYDPLASRHPGMRRYVSVHRSIAHLYDALGIAPSIQLATEDVTDNNNDGSVNRRFRSEYDTAGRRTAVISDDDGDGDDDYRATYAYDANGFVIRSTQEYDSDDNNTDYEDRDEYVSTFNVNGDYVSDERTSYADNVLVTRQREVSTFDAANRRTARLTESFVGADMLTSLRSSTYSYDERGNNVGQRDEFDDGADTVVDAVYVTTQTFDAQNRVLTSLRQTDESADGTFDSGSRRTYTYGNGPYATETVGESLDADGVVVRRETGTTQYNANGQESSRITTFDYDADGLAIARYVSVYTFDALGHIVLEESTTDDDGDGALEQTTRESTEWDAFGNRVLQLVEYDDGADGDVDSRYRYTQTVDAYGDVVADITEVDADGDGTYETTNVVTTLYVTFADAFTTWLARFFDQS